MRHIELGASHPETDKLLQIAKRQRRMTAVDVGVVLLVITLCIIAVVAVL